MLYFLIVGEISTKLKNVWIYLEENLMKTKRILALTLAIALAFSFTFATTAFANTPQVTVTVDGERVTFAEQQPIIVDGRTLVPVRSVFEFMGFEVDWDADAEQATISNDYYEIVLTAGSTTFTTNGTSGTLDVPAQLTNGSILLPVRAVLESVGYNVYWDHANRTVIVLSMSAMDLLLKSEAAMADITGFDSTMEMTMSMAVEGETINSVVTGNVSTHLDPIAMRMTMTTVMTVAGETVEMDIDSYIIHEGDYLIVYMYMMGEWVKQTSPFSQELWDELMAMNTPEMSAELYKSATVVGSERIRNIDTWRVDVVMDFAGAVAMLEGMDGLADMLDAGMFDGMGDVAATLWIAKDGFYTVRMDMDMTDMMAGMMAEMGITISEVSLSMTSFNFNNPSPVVLPEAAADAVEMELL